MKALSTAIIIVLVVHGLALIGLASYLLGTGRLSKDRLEQAREMFALSVEAEREQKEKEEAEAAEQAAEQAANQPGVFASTADRLAESEERNEILLRQLERTRRDIESLTQNLNLTRKRMREEREQTKLAREAFDQKLKGVTERLDDEGFQKTVALFEQLPAKQVKGMFVELMAQGQTEQVVTYLEAMQPRVAAAVLKEFKAGSELQAAVELTERLRSRGSDLAKQVEGV